MIEKVEENLCKQEEGDALYFSRVFCCGSLFVRVSCFSFLPQPDSTMRNLYFCFFDPLTKMMNLIKMVQMKVLEYIPYIFELMSLLYLMYKLYLRVCKNTDLCIALISNAEVFHLFYLYTNTFVMTPFRPSAMLKKPPFNTRVYYVNVKGSYLVLE